MERVTATHVSKGQLTFKGNQSLFTVRFKEELKKYPCIKICKACHVIIICVDSCVFNIHTYRMSQDNVKTSSAAKTLLFLYVLHSSLILAV